MGSREVFEANLAEIRRHNAGDSTWKAGVNKVGTRKAVRQFFIDRQRSSARRPTTHQCFDTFATEVVLRQDGAAL